MTEKTFKNAVTLLNKRFAKRSLRRSPSTGNLSNLPHTPAFRGTPHIENMKEWLQKLGHKSSDIDSLNAIHVAGTKGKGSTCAYIESMLRAHGRRTGFPKKIGLYTSPHLVDVTERIRINFVPISESKFTENFFEVWDGLNIHVDDDGPRALQLLALTSFHTFIKERVDLAIYETHHGGEFDVTNVINRPTVTVITSIGLDHVAELGPTLENIAWHKAGIFKTGVCAFSRIQQQAVAEVLENRAKEKGVSLKFVDIDAALPDVFHSSTQRGNASIAKEVSNAFLNMQNIGDCLSKHDIDSGIGNFYWPGRFQIVRHKRMCWYLDGAHNCMSAVEAARWINTVALNKCGSARNVLLFALDSDRHDGYGMLKCISTTLEIPLTNIYITSCSRPPVFDYAGKYGKVCEEYFPGTPVVVAPENAVSLIESLGGEDHLQVFVTGSLYLVGNVLKMLGQRI